MAHGRENGSGSPLAAPSSSLLKRGPLAGLSEFLSGNEPVSTADIVSRAASIVSREAAALPAMVSAVPGLFASPPGASLPSGSAMPAVPDLPALQGAADIERLRRQAHDLIEALLTTVSPKASSAEERVPLLRCAAPAQAGGEGTVTLRVANDEATPLEVTLYSSNFVSDCGGDIPSMRVTVSPRIATIPSRGETAFEVKIAVPQQAPPGIYSGLVQAMGAYYVKAVVCIEVK